MAKHESKTLSYEMFNEYLKKMHAISEQYKDGWILHYTDFDNLYLTKTKNVYFSKGNTTLTYEYHVAHSMGYQMPVLCFDIWRPNGSLLTVEEYWEYNDMLSKGNRSIYETIAQLDHPELHRPILILHPCRTHEIIEPPPFLNL